MFYGSRDFFIKIFKCTDHFICVYSLIANKTEEFVLNVSQDSKLRMKFVYKNVFKMESLNVMRNVIMESQHLKKVMDVLSVK